MREHGRIVSRQRGQFEDGYLRGPKRHRRRRRRAARRLSRKGEHICIDRARPDAALLGINDLAQFERVLPPAPIERNDVARRERKSARREREVRALAARPDVLQPDIGAPFHRGVIGDDGEIGMRDPRGTADEAARRDGCAAVVGFGVGVSDGDLARQLGLLRAREPQRRGFVRQHEIVFGERCNWCAAARAKADDASLLACVERIGECQRLDRGAR